MIRRQIILIQTKCRIELLVYGKFLHVLGAKQLAWENKQEVWLSGQGRNKGGKGAKRGTGGPSKRGRRK